MAAKAKYAQGKKFVFTVNNYEDDAVEKLKAIEWIKYCVVGREVGESGTPHLQGYMQCSKKTWTTQSGLAKRLRKSGIAAHVELQRGTNEEARKYCKKADPKAEEWGRYAEGGQGERTDISSFLKAAAGGDSDVELAETYPTEFCKYHRAAEKIRKAAKSEKAADKMKKRFKGAELRDWQAEVVERVEAQNDRQVTWVIDPKGGKGKSWLANWLYANKDAFIVDCGKQADIAHAYDCQGWVVFDITRSREENVNYQVIECFKNGRIFSPKYDSCMKIFDPAKVIVFANWAPDYSALSEDRWDIVDMEAESDEQKFIREQLRKRPAWGVFAEYEPEEEREKRSAL